MLLTGISDVRMSISILTRSLICLCGHCRVLIQVKCSLMTQEQHSNSYIYSPFLGDVLLKPLSYYQWRRDAQLSITDLDCFDR